jgi:hypothetical protein
MEDYNIEKFEKNEDSCKFIHEKYDFFFFLKQIKILF